MDAFINISAYLFTPLHHLGALRERLLAAATAGSLKGTVLLSPEGINVFVAGMPTAVAAFVALLHTVPGLEHLALKESTSATQPFGRMQVKIKKEIIAFGVEGIDPARNASEKLSAQTLKRWLDEGQAVTLLDTRNDYEVDLGTFRGAQRAGIARFRDFPNAVARLPQDWKEGPLVVFCTGGIRCEKAGPLLEREGFRHVFQLDGGILKYFEQCGGAHFDGECFVFDERVGVDASLRAIAPRSEPFAAHP